MRKLRRMLALRYYKIKGKFISQLKNIMKAVHDSIKSEEDDLYKKYLNHCVIMISKVWRGYHLRRFVKPRLLRELKAKRTFTAAVRGWKLRRIMSNTREVINVKREMAEIGYEMRRVFKHHDLKKEQQF
jgi:hypothetical protein